MAAARQRSRDPRIGMPDLQSAAFECQLPRNSRWNPSPLVQCFLVAGPRIEHDDPLAGTRKIVRGDEIVHAGADDSSDTVHYAPSSRIARAARRPGPPMTPPPGCVPEPHW